MDRPFCPSDILFNEPPPPPHLNIIIRIRSLDPWVRSGFDLGSFPEFGFEELLIFLSDTLPVMINGYDSIGGIRLVISYVRLVTCLVSLSIVLLLRFKDISLSGNGHFKNFQVYFF